MYNVQFWIDFIEHWSLNIGHLQYGPPFGRYVPGLALRSATPYRDVSGSFQSPPLHIARPVLLLSLEHILPTVSQLNYVFFFVLF